MIQGYEARMAFTFHPVAPLTPIGCTPYRAYEDQRGASFWWEVKPFFYLSTT